MRPHRALRPARSGPPGYHAHRLRIALVMVGVLAAGCLKLPKPVNEDDDAGRADAAAIDGAADASGDVADARPSNCLARAGLTPSGFFGDAVTQIRDIVAEDVNDDGFDDLIISSTPGAAADDWAVYVMLGPQSDDQNLAIHARISTAVRPLGLHVADLVGNDGCLEIAVFGQTEAGPARVEVYRQLTTGGNLYDGSPTQRDPGFVPEATGPVLVTSGDFAGDGGGVDVIVTDLTNLVLLATAGDLATNLPTSPIRPIAPDGLEVGGQWTDINAIQPSPGVRSLGGDDIVVVEQHFVRWMKNDGAGQFTPTNSMSSQTMFSARDVSPIDLDGVPPIDYVGGSFDTFGGFAIAAAGNDVQIRVVNWNTAAPVRDDLEDIVVADLGGGGLPEVVIIDDDMSQATAARAFTVDNMLLSGTLLSPTSWATYDFAGQGIDPQRGVAIDFDGDGTREVWMFDTAGPARCMRRVASGNLMPCTI